MNKRVLYQLVGLLTWSNLSAALAATPCDGALGGWQWMDGGLVVINDDFKAESRAVPGGPTIRVGDWWCDYDSRELTIQWLSGTADTVVPSADGQRLEYGGRQVAGRPGADTIPAADVVAASQDEQIDAGMAEYNRGNFSNALRIFQPLAELGNARAQNNLAALYEQGRGVARDDARAAFWFERAANGGHRMAQYNLARLHLTGRLQPADPTLAQKLLLQSAEQGYAPAQNELGHLHYERLMEGANDRAAVRWFRLAALNDEPYAQYNLGMAYENGRGVPANLEAAWQWYGKSAAGHGTGAEASKAAEARDRVLERLSHEIAVDMTFEARRTETGELYSVEPVTANALADSGDFRPALFGFNLALAEMADHGQSADWNATLEGVYWGRILALTELGRVDDADRTFAFLAEDTWWAVVEDPDYALEASNRLLAGDPDNLRYLALRAEAFLELGRRQQADADIARLQQLDEAFYAEVVAPRLAFYNDVGQGAGSANLDPVVIKQVHELGVRTARILLVHMLVGDPVAVTAWEETAELAKTLGATLAPLPERREFSAANLGAALDFLLAPDSTMTVTLREARGSRMEDVYQLILHLTLLSQLYDPQLRPNAIFTLALKGAMYGIRSQLPVDLYEPLTSAAMDSVQPAEFESLLQEADGRWKQFFASQESQ